MPAGAEATVLIGVDLSQAQEAYARIEQQIKAVLDKTGHATDATGEKIIASLSNAGRTGGKELEQLLDKHATKATSNLKEKFGEIGKMGAGMFLGGAAMQGAAGIMAYGDKLIEKGKEEIELNLKLQKAYMSTGMSRDAARASMKANGDQIDALKEKYLVDDDAIKNATQAYLQYGGTVDGLKGKQEIMIGLSERLVAKGMDQESAMKKAAIMIAKTGGEEALGGLAALGISLDKNATQAERMAAMQGEAAKGLKGLAEAANEPEADMKRLSLIVDDIEKGIGAGLARAVGVVGSAINSTVGFVSEYADVFLTLGAIVAGVTIAVNAQTIATMAGTVAATIRSGVTAAQTLIFGTSAAVIAAHASAVAAGTVAEEALTVQQGLLNAVMAMNPIGLVVIGLVALVAAVVLAYNHFTVVRATVNAVGAAFMAFWETIKAIGSSVAKIIHGMFTLNLSEVTDGIKGAVVAYSTAAQNIGSAAKASFDRTYDEAGKAIEATGAEIDTAKQKTVEWSETVKGLATAFDESMKAAQESVKQGESALAGIVEKFLKEGKTKREAMRSDEYKRALAEARVQAKEMQRMQGEAKEVHVQVFGDPSKAKDLKAQHDATLKAIEDFLAKQSAAVLVGRSKDIATADLTYKTEHDKLQAALDKKAISQKEFDALELRLNASHGAAIRAVNEKYDAEELKAQQEADQKRFDARAKFAADTQKLEGDAAKKRAARRVELMQEGADKELAAANQNYAEEIQAEHDALAQRLQELQTKMGSGELLWAEYHNEVLSAQARANDAESDAFAAHQKRLLDIQVRALDERTGIVSAGNAAWQNMDGQLHSWLDERLNASVKNQKTALASIEHAVVASLATTASAKVAAYAQDVVLGEANILLDVESIASSLAAAAAKVFEFYASFGPFGIPLAIGTVGALYGAYEGLKGMFGAAQGGVMVGENGPELITAPATMVDYTTMMAGMAARGIDAVVARANYAISGSQQGRAMGREIAAHIDGALQTRGFAVDTHHTTNVNMQMKRTLSGREIYATEQADSASTARYYQQ